MMNIKIFKKLKQRLNIINKIFINIRFLVSSDPSISKAKKVFVLSSFSVQEKQALYNKATISIRGAIQKVNKSKQIIKKMIIKTLI